MAEDAESISERRPRLEMVYDHDGELYTLMIEWRGDKIQVISNPGNAPTRELQRADEIIQALVRYRK